MQIPSSTSSYQAHPTNSYSKSDSTSINATANTAAVSATQAKAYSTESKNDYANKHTDSVSLSTEAKALSAASQQAPINSDTSKKAVTLPAEPTSPSLPHDGEKVENYIHYKKAQVQYQFYADLAGAATGNGSMSATSAYIVKNNDEARAATVNAASMNQQQAVLNSYVETTQSINASA
ncbi:hypothetical protein [Shewanella donghaensis]|uniref:hypothetical protein n=1 Tax=Shewanella donghaensis TaxID=238836 RepID=UPI0011829B8D|nr:hypothetical protein [Shewanella donghaensis]